VVVIIPYFMLGGRRRKGAISVTPGASITGVVPAGAVMTINKMEGIRLWNASVF